MELHQQIVILALKDCTWKEAAAGMCVAQECTQTNRQIFVNPATQSVHFVLVQQLTTVLNVLDHMS